MDLVNGEGAAKLLNVNRSTVLRMVRDGRLIPLHTFSSKGGKLLYYLFDRATIERMAQEKVAA